MRACLMALMLGIVAGCATTDLCTSQQTETTVQAASDFTSTTVDFGIVVSDVDKAADFYINGLGFTEVAGFDVPASMGGDAGLSDDKPFHVRVMKLEDSNNATAVKLVSFPDAPGVKPKNDFIHTTLGVSYLTVFVSDITAAVQRARKAGASPLANGPIPLPEGFPEGIYLAVVRDPDGNMIELVGPLKK